MTILLAGCSPDQSSSTQTAADDASIQQAPSYDALIRWTSYGVPHIKADDAGSLGYGFGYAKAKDAVCVLARAFMMVNGELSKYLGPEKGNLQSDIFHKALLDEATVDRYKKEQRADTTQMSEGFAAGFNRYLQDQGGDSLPGACRGKPWVRDVTQRDMYRLYIGFGIRYGVGYFMNGIASAAPPGTDSSSTSSSDLGSPPDPSLFGSNAYALGKAVTANGRGMVLGNPHYPWRGPSRFHIAHLTIPGDVNVMGVGLITTPSIGIGFNQHIAWSHTVSSALRFTLYELSLVKGDPLSYVYGDGARRLELKNVEVDIKSAEATIKSEQHSVYMSHYGPVLVDKALPWTNERLYTIRDVNLNNYRSAEQYYRLNRATSVDEVATALTEVQGVAFVNTIAADRSGVAFYGDVSAIPNVDQKMIDACQSQHVNRVSGRSMVVLNGSNPDCEWRTDETAAAPGVLPPEKLPMLRREDYVTNSNDSYWLSNPDEPLEGYSPIVGNERTARSLRTRAGLKFISEVIGGDQPQKFTPRKLQSLMFNHRNFGAELLLDDLLAICAEQKSEVPLPGGTIDVSKACQVLSAWDRRQDLDSRGAQVYTEFWRRAARIENLYAVPFDPTDPVNTPSGLNGENKSVRQAIMTALAGAVHALDEAEIPLDAPWGEVQYSMAGEEKIGIPGGSGGSGMFSNISAPLTKGKGYTPIVAGNSYIQVVTWDDDGNPDANVVLTYSQSQQPESPHFADQTRLYSKGEWVKLPFTEEQIGQDPQLTTLRLMGPR
jgi:acyl-homoserine-lactone acylase|tara:strand:- start:9135 stop:11453 length:2319 start_codon:yes stop_codon:yes gene_type:complete